MAECPGSKKAPSASVYAVLSQSDVAIAFEPEGQCSDCEEARRAKTTYYCSEECEEMARKQIWGDDYDGEERRRK